MNWFQKLLEAVQTAAVIGERVDRLTSDVAMLAGEQREMDRRLSRLEGAATSDAPTPKGGRGGAQTKR